MKPPCKKPCQECPFLRTALKGYVGATTPEKFIQTTLAEFEMPCHMKVDYTNEDWRETLDDVPQCAGAAIFFANQCKLPRNPAIKLLPRDRKNVFSFADEFLRYHTREEITEEEVRDVVTTGNMSAMMKYQRRTAELAHGKEHVA